MGSRFWQLVPTPEHDSRRNWKLRRNSSTLPYKCNTYKQVLDKYNKHVVDILSVVISCFFSGTPSFSFSFHFFLFLSPSLLFISLFLSSTPISLSHTYQNVYRQTINYIYSVSAICQIIILVVSGDIWIVVKNLYYIFIEFNMFRVFYSFHQSKIYIGMIFKFIWHCTIQTCKGK